MHSELNNLRSIYVPKTKTLLINKNIDDAQRAFIYAKELAYNFLNIEDRLYTFSWIAFDNFDQVYVCIRLPSTIMEAASARLHHSGWGCLRRPSPLVVSVMVDANLIPCQGHLLSKLEPLIGYTY